MKKCYVIICDIENNTTIDSVWLNPNDVSNRMEQIKHERNDVFGDYDDCITFENDDVYYIRESYIKDYDENKSKS